MKKNEDLFQLIQELEMLLGCTFERALGEEGAWTVLSEVECFEIGDMAEVDTTGRVLEFNPNSFHKLLSRFGVEQTIKSFEPFYIVMVTDLVEGNVTDGTWNKSFYYHDELTSAIQNFLELYDVSGVYADYDLSESA